MTYISSYVKKYSSSFVIVIKAQPLLSMFDYLKKFFVTHNLNIMLCHDSC